MQYDVFEKPVRVLVGLGMPRDIVSVFQAYAFLNEMPRERGKVDHAVARKACLAAMNRTGDADSARRALVAYAERAGILAGEVEGTLAPIPAENQTIRLAS